MKFLRQTKKLSVSIPAFLLLIVLFFQGINFISAQTVAEQKRSLEEALHRNIIHCYTVNGFYPESLEYLCSHYPLSYDEDLFIIHYQPVAANLMPDVTVLEREETQ